MTRTIHCNSREKIINLPILIDINSFVITDTSSCTCRVGDTRIHLLRAPNAIASFVCIFAKRLILIAPDELADVNTLLFLADGVIESHI